MYLASLSKRMRELILGVITKREYLLRATEDTVLQKIMIASVLFFFNIKYIELHNITSDRMSYIKDVILQLMILSNLLVHLRILLQRHQYFNSRIVNGQMSTRDRSNVLNFCPYIIERSHMTSRQNISSKRLIFFFFFSDAIFIFFTC